VIALFVIFILFLLEILIIAIFIIVHTFIISRFVIIFGLESTSYLFMARFPLFLTKTILCLTHLILLKHLVFILSIIVEDLLFFSFLLLTFEFINDISLFGSSLNILKVVHVELVFEIVDVCELFYVNSVESFKFVFETFIFFLVLWLNIFDTFESFLSSFQFLLSSRKFVPEFTIIEFQLFDCVFHFLHFGCLVANYISNASFNVNLFSVSI